MGKQTEIQEMTTHIRGLEGLRAEMDKFLKEHLTMDEYYFKVLRDRNNLICKIVSMKNHIDRLKKPKEGGIEPMAIPYGAFNK